MNQLESLEMTIMAKILKQHEERVKVLEAALSITLLTIKDLQDSVKKLEEGQ